MKASDEKSDQKTAMTESMGKWVKKTMNDLQIKVAIIAERPQGKGLHCVWHKLGVKCGVGFCVIQRKHKETALQLVSTLEIGLSRRHYGYVDGRATNALTSLVICSRFSFMQSRLQH